MREPWGREETMLLFHGMKAFTGIEVCAFTVAVCHLLKQHLHGWDSKLMNTPILKISFLFLEDK